MVTCADYLRKFLDPRHRTRVVSHLADAIRRWDEQPHFVACSGVSGLLLGPPVAAALGIGLAIVRKTYYSHSDHSVEIGGLSRCQAGQAYAIVDDFISSGATIERIRKGLSDYRCIGVALASPLYDCDHQPVSSNPFKECAERYPAIKGLKVTVLS